MLDGGGKENSDREKGDVVSQSVANPQNGDGGGHTARLYTSI